MSKAIRVRSGPFVFRFEDVPKKKRDNWMAMKRGAIDPDTCEVTAYPGEYQIEPTSFCNLSCDTCPSAAGARERERPPRHMSLSEFKGLMEDIRDYVMLVNLWGWGEPFMNPDLPGMIARASACGAKVMTSTNGTYLRERDLMSEAMRSGLAGLIVSLDTLDGGVYPGHRGGLDPGAVVDGLKKTMALRDELGCKTLIDLRMVVSRGNEHEIPALRDLAKTVGVDSFTVKSINVTHKFGMDNKEELVPRAPALRRYVYDDVTMMPVRRPSRECSMGRSVGYTHSDGTVVACCWDYSSRYLCVGSVFKRPFTELWNDVRFRDVRKSMRDNATGLEMCGECGANYVMNPAGLFPVSERYSSEGIERMREFARGCRNRFHGVTRRARAGR